MADRWWTDGGTPPVSLFSAVPGSVAAARHWIAAQLHDLNDDDFTDLLTLLASELVTNAVRHSAGTTVKVELIPQWGYIRCQVTDAGSSTSMPTVKDPAEDEDGGRGLKIVEELSEQWGAWILPDRTSVWFDVTIPKQTPPAPPP